VLRTTRFSWLPAVSIDVTTEGIMVFTIVTRVGLGESVIVLVWSRCRIVSMASVRKVTTGSRVVVKRVSRMSGNLAGNFVHAGDRARMAFARIPIFTSSFGTNASVVCKLSRVADESVIAWRCAAADLVSGLSIFVVGGDVVRGGVSFVLSFLLSGRIEATLRVLSGLLCRWTWCRSVGLSIDVQCPP